MKRYRALSRGLVAVPLALALAACSTSADPEDAPSPGGDEEATLTIGFVVKSMTYYFWLDLLEGAQSAGDEMGDVEIISSGPTSESAVSEQINQVEDMVNRGVDALVVAPVAPVQLEPVLSRAVEAGIPVVVLDTRIEGFEDTQSAFVGTDDFAGGEAAGKYIVEQLGGTGTLALVNGTPGVPAVDDRIAGVREAVSDTDIEVVAELAAEACTEDRGVTAGEDLLTAHPDVDAIFAACGGAAVGVAQSIRAAGRSWDSIVLVGFGAAPEELASC